MYRNLHKCARVYICRRIGAFTSIVVCLLHSINIHVDVSVYTHAETPTAPYQGEISFFPYAIHLNRHLVKHLVPEEFTFWSSFALHRDCSILL